MNENNEHNISSNKEGKSKDVELLKTRINDLHAFLKLTIPIIFIGFALILAVASGITSFMINSKVESERENIRDFIKIQKESIDERLGKLNESPRIEVYADKEKTPLINATLEPDYFIEKNELHFYIYLIIHNISNSVTNQIVIKLYANKPLSLPIASADELSYENELTYPGNIFMPPAFSSQFKVWCKIDPEHIVNNKEKVMIKVYYGNKEPYVSELFIKIDKDKIKPWVDKIETAQSTS